MFNNVNTYAKPHSYLSVSILAGEDIIFSEIDTINIQEIQELLNEE
jgi:hypothetical protein